MNANRQLKLASCDAFAGRLIAEFAKLIVLSSVICFGTSVQADIAYVANDNDGSISVINTSTNKVIKTINVGGNPTMVAVSPDGKRAYVGCSANSSTERRICVIDTTTYNVIATSSISATPTAWGGTMAIRGNNFYVACEVRNICKIDMNTYARIGSPIPVGLNPHTIVISPSNTRLYVTNSQDHNVSVIDIATNANLATISVEKYPFGAAITPDGSKLYVASQSGTVSVINTSNNSVAKTIPVGGGSTGVAINPTGTRVYITNHYGTVSSGIPSNTVSVIDTSTDTNIATIPVGTMPVGVSVNLSGTYVYVTNVQNNNVSVIDAITNKVVATIPVGLAPYAASEFIGPDPLTCKVESDTAKNEGIQVGIQQCKTNPASYGLFTQMQLDAAKQTGIDQCKTNPASCGLFTQTQIDAAKQTGIDQCKTNPASCGLFTQTQIDAAKQTGIDQCKTNPTSCNIVTTTDQCKTNPASCGLFTQTQIDAAKQTGINQCKTNPTSCNIVTTTDQCKTNPASCGLFTQAQLDTAKQSGITQCKTNPISCGITKIDGISTNAFVTPANKMIAGVLISGGTKRVMVRASSVDGAVDPLVEIFTYPDRKLLGNNDSWATDPAATELTQKKLAPARATDAATILSLPPGLFTMEITSKNGGSGANVIEVYDMLVFP